MGQSKIGYQVHNVMTYERGWSAEETDYFWQHLERLNPAAMLFLDDDGKAAECKRRFPGCAVVVRQWLGGEGKPGEGDMHLSMSPEQVFGLYKNTPGDLIRNIGNEPNGYGDLATLARWYARVMDLFGDAGLAIAVPGFGEGHPSETRLAELKPLWDALDKWHGRHYYNIHEYGTWRGMLFAEGDNFHVYPWRVGRFETFTVKYLRDNGHKIPRVIVTEWGIDSAHDGTNKRGWRDSMTEVKYARELDAALAKVYTAPHYVGLCLFSWGNSGKKNTGDDWVTFDVSEAKTLHTELENMRAQEAPAPTPAPVEPPAPVVVEPPHPGAAIAGTNRTGGAVIIRHIAGKPGGKQIGTIPPMAQYTYYPATAVEADGYTWVWAECGNERGWSALEALAIDDVPETPAGGAADDRLRAQVEALTARVAALEAGITKLNYILAAFNAAIEKQIVNGKE